MSMKLGERLVKESMVDTQEINLALQIQQEHGGLLGDILLASTSMRSLDYYQVLAKHYQLEFVNLLKQPIDENLLKDADKKTYLDKACIPIRQDDGVLTVATANPSPETFSFIKSHWGENTKMACTSKYDILHALQRRFSKDYLNDAINSLVKTNAHLSSKHILSRWQLLFFICIIALSAYGLARHPLRFLIGVNYYLMTTVAGVIFYKIILSFISYIIYYFKKPDTDKLPETELPVYSILVPLYQEKEITLRHLFNNLEKLDYPKHLLDIKVLIEQDDLETVEILKSLRPPSYFEYIYVPPGKPRTKAKACNYGLRFARGDFLTLYDAEDKPDPMQLRLALSAFNKYKTERLACVQSRLNFYNSNDNWLTKMFTIEYTYWFDLFLPGLECMGTPIPLGGTSNHFKTYVLRELYAWDPYNVTEDADLGIRLARLGYTTRVIDSTTYEEANCELLNWLRQRTRWIKGYVQTYLVHMRNPLTLWHSLGTRGYLGFQLFVGGTILTNLSNLLLWLIFLLSCIPSTEKVDSLFPQKVINFAMLNFVLGTVGMIILNLLGVLRRKQYKLLLVTLTSPLYWLLMSIASYRAIYQLIFSPSHWEKTEHGISKTLN